jgi:hypothetical protein
MVHYSCDFCGRMKQAGEEWFLGFAAENRGVTAARREIVIAPQWDEDRAVDWLAVHFCSAEHKDQYTAALFAAAPRPLDTTTTAAVRVLTRKPTGRGTAVKKKTAVRRTLTRKRA